MNCNETYSLLHAYVDSELDLMRSLEIERHLKTCAACASVKRSLQSFRSTLRHSNLSYSAPPALRDRILSKVSQNTNEPAVPKSTPWLWQWLAAGAIGFAVMTVILRPAGVPEGDRLADEAVSGHVRSLMAGHLTDVLSSDKHTVKPWFNGKVDFAPDVNNFAAQGFPLIGGRLDYLNGRRVAALVYKRNAHVINVFVWPTNRAGTESTENRDGFNIINQTVGGLHYCIVSDLNASELNEFARLFQY